MDLKTIRIRLISAYTVATIVMGGFTVFIVFSGLMNDDIGVDAAATLTVGQAGSGAQHNTIQAAIDAANPGDTIRVWAGTYNENITVSKNVYLIGNSSSNTSIDASGQNNNAVNITVDGVEITSFNITSGSPWYAIEAIVGGFNIHHNNITGQGGGINVTLLDIGRDLSGATSVVVGNMTIHSNNITAGNDSISIDIQNIGYNMTDTASLQFGALNITFNIITANRGINITRIDNLGYKLSNNSAFTWGGLYVDDNIINASQYGIYHDSGIFPNYYYIGYWGVWLNDSASYNMGDVSFSRNNITAGINGIDLGDKTREWGVWMNGSSSFTVGSVLFNDNVINATNRGIVLTELSRLGSYMNGSSIFEMGDISFDGNRITTQTGDGMYFDDFNDWGRNMYGHSSFTGGNVTFNDNNITAGNHGINHVDLGGIGYHMHDNSTYVMGDIELNSNWIDTNVGHGIYLDDFDWWGSDIYNSTSFIMDDFTINDNVISAGSTGIYHDGCGFHGYSVWVNSTYTMDKIEIQRNVIDAGTDGVILDQFNYWGYWLTGTSTFIMGDFLLNDNVINATGHGVHQPGGSANNFGSWGRNLYDTSSTTLGNISFDGNDIVAGDMGMTVYINRTGYDVFNNSYLSIGDILLKNNNITTQSTGIDILHEECGGVYDTSTAYLPGITIQDNDVNSVISAFNYTTINTPNNNDPGATRVWEDVILKDNDLDGGLFGAVFDWQDPNSTAVQPVFYVQNTDIRDGSGDSLGMYFNNIGNVSIDRTTIDGFSEGIHVNNSNIVMMVNSTISNIATTDLNLSSDSYVVTLNTTFNKNSVNFEDDQSMLKVGWYMNVEVINQIGQEVPNANLIVKDSDATEIFNDTTDAEGKASYIVVWEYLENITGVIDTYTNHTADADDGEFFGSASPDPYMDQTKVVTIVVMDIDAPMIISDNSDTIATTRDPFNFIIDAIDNFNLSEVHVVWWFGTGTPTNDTMTGTGPYYFSIQVPSNSLDQLHYYFTLNDASNNWFSGVQVDINVIDNDAPIYNWVSQPTAGTTGDSVFVSIMATDNINITYYKIDIDGLVYDMVRDVDYYNFTINIPPNSTESLTYRIGFKDSALNLNVTPDTEITVTDNDPPVYSWVHHPTSGSAESYPFVYILATDNIGITNYTIYIDGTPYDIFKNGDIYMYVIEIPPSRSSDIIYYVTFEDAAGNSNTTNTTVVKVTLVEVDLEAPKYIWVLRPTAGTTGESAVVSLKATDTVGVTYYKIDIDGIHFDMEKDGDHYTYTIDVPSDSIEPITYSVTFNNSANLPNATDATVMNVTDNDAPTDLVDTSDTAATTGDPFAFGANAVDNIGVDELHVVYWYGDGAPTNTSMTGTGPLTLGITIPSDSVDTLYYYFAVSDEAGNWLAGTQVDITVTDNDPGSVSSEASDPSGKEGDDFQFQIDVVDNIGITEVKVVYWFGDDDSPEKSLILNETDGTYSGSFTPEQSGVLNYYFEVTDTSGNTMKSDEFSANIDSQPEEEDEEKGEDKGISTTTLSILAIVIILVVVVLILMMRKKKDEVGKQEEEVVAPPVMGEGEVIEGPEGVEEEFMGEFEESEEELGEVEEEEVLEEEVVEEELGNETEEVELEDEETGFEEGEMEEETENISEPEEEELLEEESDELESEETSEVEEKEDDDLFEGI